MEKSINNNNPLISVVMPAYNADKYIGQAIDSVIAQTISEWELIIVDDCSTDNTLKIAEDYASRDPRIRIIKREKRAGRGMEPRRMAIMAARSEWISKLDADDLIRPDTLEILLKRREETLADIVLPTVYKFSDTKAPVLFKPFMAEFYKRTYNGRELIKHTLNGWQIAMSGGLTRRSFYIAIYNKYSYPKGNLFIDEICSRHLLLENPLIAFCKARYYYRCNPESVTTDKSGIFFDFILLNLALIDLAKEEFGPESEEYRQAQQQNFYGIFDMYKRMNRNNYSRAELQKGRKLIKKARRAIDWDVIAGNVSPRYRLLLKIPGLPVQLILRLFKKI